MIGGHRVIALLLSGGGGTRLWPVSTSERPKQFLKLFGDRSLYQLTLSRLAAADIDDVIVVANAAHEAEIREQTAALGLAAPTLVLEPMRRDSAAAIAAGVAAAMTDNAPDTIVIALPCDHLISDDAHFARSLSEAVTLAALGYLGTFGIRPTFPSTQYGYIQRAAPISGHGNAFAVAKFHEKPTIDVATAYVEAGDYDWNSGMFTFRADTFAAEAERHMPDIWLAAIAAVRTGASSATRLALSAEAFGRAPKTSIDRALFEKSDRVGMVPVSFAWSDVGNWASVHGALAKDAAGNAVIGSAAVHDAAGNLVVGSGVKVVLLGVNDLAVVTSPHGVFIAPLSRVAEVKALIEE